MSDTGSNCDNKPQQEDVNLEESQAEAVPEVENKPVTPVKRTPSKRLTAVERAQRESEELVKTLGGSLDIEGGRKTRSSTRGTPSRSNVVHTPPPTKRARAATGTPKRGRGRKLETAIEDDIKASPEKVPSEAESNHDENESSAVVDAVAKKTQDSAEDENDKPVATETPSEVTEEKPSPAKQDAEPEQMEVDGVSKETTVESEKVDESAQNESESFSKPIDDESEKSEKVVTATPESSSKPTEDVAGPPSTKTDDEQNAPLGSEKAENVHESNVKENDIEKVNSNSLPAEVSLPIPTPTPTPTAIATPTPTPATQVSVAGNEHKAESNDLCEPKIASPPITANNDGATPQYCN